MDTLSLLGTAFGLGMDAFAVGAAISAGQGALSNRQTFRLIWHFGLFQALMPIIGWLGGEGLANCTGGLNHWISFGLLLAIGGNMVRESRHPEEGTKGFDPTRGWSLVALSVATSIDALAVGVSLGLLGVSVWNPAVIIGLTALVMTFVGIRLGRTVGVRMGQCAELAGGTVLIAIGIRILADHLLGR
ncbi:MAG: manganese efflux pump MntP family protein [Thermodesulfobacteriota bacterium]